jgi:hypothetical protein
MLNNSRVDKKWFIPFIWLSAGFVSWFLSKFLFSYILSPLLIETVRAANANTRSVILQNMVNMGFANMADFTLCFSFGMLLSYFSKFNMLRVLLFASGAVAISLYARIEALIGYMGMYSQLPPWAVASEMQGFISLLLIVPLCSIAGGKVGTWLNLKKKPV